MAHFHIYDTCLKQGVLPRNKRIPPHGKEWKQQFRNSFQPFLTADIFPAVVLAALYDHLKNPRASSCTDSLLARVLLQFDRHSPGILMEALPAGCLFTAQGGRLFRKEAKLRKRYRCLRLNDGKIFLFSPLARVFRVDQQK